MLFTVVLFVGAALSPAVSQQADGRVLILETPLEADSSKNPTVELRKGVVYRANIAGIGTPVFTPVRGKRRAFLVPVDQGTTARHFQVFALESGPHRIGLVDQDLGATVTLRLFEDVAATEQSQRKRESGVAIGLSVAGGAHTAMAIDSFGGATPRGGSDIEGCVLVQPGERFGTCLGGGRVRFPDDGLTIGWLFLEERVRFLGRPGIGGRTLDLNGTIRYSKAMGVGSRNEYPGLVSTGLQLAQHLSPRGRWRGASVFASWQHAWLFNVPRSRDRQTNRFLAGVSWLP